MHKGKWVNREFNSLPRNNFFLPSSGLYWCCIIFYCMIYHAWSWHKEEPYELFKAVQPCAAFFFSSSDFMYHMFHPLVFSGKWVVCKMDAERDKFYFDYIYVNNQPILFSFCHRNVSWLLLLVVCYLDIATCMF